MKKRILAGVLLALLLLVPFLNWRIGALLWMSAWLVFIFQNIFSRQGWRLGGEGNDRGPDHGGKDD